MHDVRRVSMDVFKELMDILIDIFHWWSSIYEMNFIFDFLFIIIILFLSLLLFLLLLLLLLSSSSSSSSSSFQCWF